MRFQAVLYRFIRSNMHLLHTLYFFRNFPLFFQQLLISFFINQSNLIAFFRQTHICIVLPQQQTVLCPGGHHPIRFPVFLRHQIIDQHADIRFGTIQNQRFFSLDLPRCIDPGDQSLCRRLFIAGASVKLAGTEQAGDIFKFQGKRQRSRINTVILNRVCVPHDLRMFQSRYRTVHRDLHILRKRARHTSNIHFIRIKSFWFNKYLMTFFIRKTNDLVLDRWTVSRSGTFNHTGIQWRTVQIITDDLMRLFICVGQPAGSLFNLYILRISRERKRHNSFIAKLLFHFGIIDRISGNSCRCSCLEAEHLDSKLFE